MILRRLHRQGERGAVALVVAVLFSFLVFAGCAALTLDVGAIDSEREQLQNGADAVALSVAMDCANLPSCLSGDAAKRAALANGNAQDHLNSIARVDGGNAICGVGGGLPSCPPLQNSLTDCVQPSGTLPSTWVRVYTQTKTASASQSTLLPYSFGSWLSGQRGIYPQACAQAGVKPGYDATKLLPLAESDCAWEASTSSGTSFAPLPAYSTAPTSDTQNKNAWPNVPTEVAPSNIVSLTVQGGGSTAPSTCGRSSSSGAYTPGNFGWLDQSGDAKTTCQGNLVNGTMTGNNGTSASQGCVSVLPTLVGTIVYLPVFTTSSGSGSSSTFSIKGAAAFYLAGVSLNGSSGKKTWNGYNPVLPPSPGVMAGCDPKDNTTNGCIWGWFLKPLVSNGTFDPTGGTLGPVSIGLLG